MFVGFRNGGAVKDAWEYVLKETTHRRHRTANDEQVAFDEAIAKV